MFAELIEFIRSMYRSNEFIPLHAPSFNGNERKYINDALDSTFVSSVGEYVDKFENQIEQCTGAAKAVATVNGTAALQTALYMAGVRAGELVLTQPLTFVATCNVIFHMGAEPVFIDVSERSLGLCPKALQHWLETNAELDSEGLCIHKADGARIAAVVPMHTFGHPAELNELIALCEKWQLPLVEDAAESLGSFYRGRHTGTFGGYGALSFNGNKLVTTGGGGAVLCRSQEDGQAVKHVTTTAKTDHPYEYRHDLPGFNFRMPNINAALGCAQLEALEEFLVSKRGVACRYREYFAHSDIKFVDEPDYARSNFWLNAVICPDADVREQLLQETNVSAVMTRPVWQLMHRLPMFSDALRGDLSTAEWLERRLVNLPSSPIIGS